MAFSFSDQMIEQFDRGLRTLTKQSRHAQRENPANQYGEESLSE